ncbi:MAG: sigma factor, partial [Planctomycetota bacterium]|nr:sigma factor [Planctomycetota bacterium]
MTRADRSKAERFVAHLEPLQRQLSVYCVRVLNRRDELEDTLQSAVANAFRDFDKYSEGTNFKAWIYRYVTLESLNRNRSSKDLAVSIDQYATSAESVLPIDSFRIEALLEAPETVLDHCDDVVAVCVKQL